MGGTETSSPLMWREYLLYSGRDPLLPPPPSWHFCDNEKDARELAQLVKNNIKTATASLEILYASTPLPVKGDLSIITDYAGKAQCIIETTEVDILPFSQVGDEFAYFEGEGDRSLSCWRQVHREYFTRELSQAGKIFTEDIHVVCERFRLVYPG